MFVGKTAQGADRMTVKLKERTVQKEYVARVKGRFPDGVVVVDQPIMSVSPKVGLNRVRATGKEAKTKFRRLAYYPPPSPTTSTFKEGENARPATPPPSYVNESEGYSIVHCLPLTGRTHQIRVHLQFLGHPISNDPIYSNRRVFGPDLGKNDSSADLDEEIIDRLMAMGRTEVPDIGPVETPKPKPVPPTRPSSEQPSGEQSTISDKGEEKDQVSYRTHFTTPPLLPPGTSASVVEAIMTKEHEAAVAEYQKRKGERLSGEKCDVCGTELYTDPGVHELGIFLHAVAYSDAHGEWSYRSKMPSWARPPKGVEGPTEVPEWVEEEEGKEVVVGDGVVPDIGVDEGDDAKKNERKGKQGVTALVEGVGMIDVSAARQAEESEDVATAAAGSA
jgi:tRNA pseudouridine synthase 9